MSLKNIHAKQGHGYDEKYSDWRRSRFPELTGKRNCYCADIDWVEWRNGKPVALLECRRALHGKSLGDAINTIIQLNNGFQLEMIACLSAGLNIPSYLVAIKDEDPEGADYSKAEFLVVKINPPVPWPTDRSAVKKIVDSLGRGENLDELGYANFISSL